MTSVFSWQNSIRLCLASFCTARPNLLVTPGISLEKAMAPYSSSLAWKIPWMEEPGRLLSPWGHKESDMTERLHFTSLHFVVNGFPRW